MESYQVGTSVSENVLRIPALGRPFRLGMFYDCRRDQMIPSVTLWDEEVLTRKYVQKQEFSAFSVSTSCTVKEKAKTLGLSGSLTLSLFSGLLGVSGAGKYFKDNKTSSNEERASLIYQCTTRSEGLTMEQLRSGGLQHPEVFGHSTATHVVTEIEYGGQAVFVFRRNKSENSKKTGAGLKASIGLSDLVTLIPGLQLNSKGKVDFEKQKKEIADEFSCQFYGDFLPQENPSSYEDAVRLYKDIPKYLSYENSVPYKVSLYPLYLLNSNANKLLREISDSLVHEAQMVVEELLEIEVKCNDLLESAAGKKFHGCRQEVLNTKESLTSQKLAYQGELCELLPRIRGGLGTEQELTEVLRQRKLFCNSLVKFIQEKETEFKILSNFANNFADIAFVVEPGDLECKKQDPNITFVFCFLFFRKNKKHIMPFIKKGKRQESMKVDDADDMSLMKRARLFKDFFEMNKNKADTVFIVDEEVTDTVDGLSGQVVYYKEGKLINSNFNIPSAPGKPQIDNNCISHDSVTLQWDPPNFGLSNVNHYEIMVKESGSDNPYIIKGKDKPGFVVPDLTLNTEYEVAVRCCCEAGVSPEKSVFVSFQTLPSSPPQRPGLSQSSATTIKISWLEPTHVGPNCKIVQYKILQQMTHEKGIWTSVAETESGDQTEIEIKVKQNVAYRFKVIADCGSAGMSKDSEESESICLQSTETDITKDVFLKASTLIQNGNPQIFQPKIKLVVSRDEDMIQMYELGVPKYDVQNKVIMVVGETGSGKSTFINGIVNCILGVEWRDKFRFKIITEETTESDAFSQTSFVASYTLHHQEGFPVPYTLTIIDTPGFGDTRGVARDKNITKQISNFFHTRGQGGIDHIDAVAFIVQSSQARLTQTQVYIFDQIQALFGKDIAENIFLLVTFSDGRKPKALSAVKEAKVPYKKCFKFNNSSLFVSNHDSSNEMADDIDADDADNFNEKFWKMGVKGYKSLLHHLLDVQSVSLVLTKEVLKERNQLQVTIAGIQEDIKIGLIISIQLKQIYDSLEAHEEEIDQSKAFEFVVDEHVIREEPVPPDHTLLNCPECKRTCHERCNWFCRMTGSYFCSAISKGKCQVCKPRCAWKLHKNDDFKYVHEVVKVKKTSNELLKRFKTACDEKVTAEKAIKQIREELDEVKESRAKLMKEVRRCLQRLNEIALKPDPVSAVDYLDILIGTEEAKKQSGWQLRVKKLKNLREETLEADKLQKLVNE